MSYKNLTQCELTKLADELRMKILYESDPKKKREFTKQYLDCSFEKKNFEQNTYNSFQISNDYCTNNTLNDNSNQAGRFGSSSSNTGECPDSIY
jgi:hypothetical protein